MPHDVIEPLPAGHRYRCDGCGNVTRFDVVSTARTRRYLHFDLGGAAVVEEEEVLEEQVRSVTCRWCARSDVIRIEPAPAAPDPTVVR
ncbi:MAG: hypothetical protein ACLFUG_04315 [Nitriliruptoraceae bacterium]